MEAFYSYLENHIQSLKPNFREKFSIRQTLFNDILVVLRDGRGDPKLRYWVHKNFKLSKIINGYIVCDIKSNLPIVTHENLYRIIKECHESICHQGRDKTWLEIKSKYAWVPIDCVKLFITQCDVCCSRKRLQSQHHNSATTSSLHYLSLLHIRLIDMCTVLDSEYMWILQVKDHYTEFVWAYPLKCKSATFVMDKLLEQFYTFGIPEVLEFDNECEFMLDVGKELKIHWGNLIITNDNHTDSGVRLHQAPESLETLESAIFQWIRINNDPNWSRSLSKILYTINTKSNDPMKKSAHEMLFGQKPRHQIDILNIPLTCQRNDSEHALSNTTPTLNDSRSYTNTEILNNVDRTRIHSLTYGLIEDASDSFMRTETLIASSPGIETTGRFDTLSLFK